MTTTSTSSENASDAPRRETCPVCETPVDSAFFEMPAMPTVCNQLFDDAGAARAVPRGDIRLAFCAHCGFVFNRAFDPARVPYGEHYENSLHFSPRFQSYAEALARRLIDRYAVRGRRVVEIACGNGEFLSLLCELGDNRGIGYDPSGVLERAAPGARDRLEIRTRFFEKEDAAEPADLICCRHALEHLEEPVPFLQMIRDGLDDRADTILYFEVPNSTWILEEFDLWDLIYEHCGYFTAPSLVHAFDRAGFDVLEVGEDFDRQFLWIEARPGDGAPGAAPDLGGLPEVVSGFARASRARVDGWRRWFGEMEDGERDVVVWGAGSKGATFVNLFREFRCLTRVVDVNPHKEGKFLSGSGHRIVHPDRLAEGGVPDCVIVMNPIYLDEVRTLLADRGLASECRVA
jgi:SAM-dependent methyltransferase